MTVVLIFDRADETVTRYDMADGDDAAFEFIWSEGNYRCDCNRALFQARARGQADPNHPCYDERWPNGRFLVHVTTASGVRVYADLDFPHRDRPREELCPTGAR